MFKSLSNLCFVSADWCLSAVLFFSLMMLSGFSFGQTLASSKGRIDLSSRSGEKLRLSAYADSIIRVQRINSHHKEFLPNNHYEAIVSHKLKDVFSVENFPEYWVVTCNELTIKIDKKDLQIDMLNSNKQSLLATEKVQYFSNHMEILFGFDEKERFIGFGQKPLGYMDRLELTGEITGRNYGEDGVPGRGAQGNLLVPFYVSNKGYGIFYNTTYPNALNFGAERKYGAKFQIDENKGQLDFIFIYGKTPAKILDLYTQLTGRPLLPPKSNFGLQLSDNEPNQNGLIDANWWQRNVQQHYNAGFPLDHMVFDNDWREGSGGWSGSWFDFSKQRYPDPQIFAQWYRDLGLTLTLDFNMNIANDSAGWLKEFNLPVKAEGCPDAHSDSYPDYTSPKVRNWIWELFYSKAFNPSVKYPGDGIWMDETDGVWSECMANNAILANGRSWLEMKNYYYFLIGKAVVEEGWFNQEHGKTQGIPNKRPYVWIRGGSAGGQRFGTHWTGDIHFDNKSMEGQILAMQASGLAGYPYFNHDAGGFVDIDKNVQGPNDNTYIQWAMALGSFTPIWRPHGYGMPRWPLNRSTQVQTWVHKYARIRYESMPYIYSSAIQSALTGLPMARPLAVAYPQSSIAWDRQSQYLWGDAFLVAPSLNLGGRGDVMSVWLPPENIWYDYWNGAEFNGNQFISYKSEFGKLPLFVKSGAIVPKTKFELNTKKQSDRELNLDVYLGDNSIYTFLEDDGITMNYLIKNSIRKTEMSLIENPSETIFKISAAAGTYSGASKNRNISIRFNGLDKLPESVIKKTNGSKRTSIKFQYDKKTKVMQVDLGNIQVNSEVSIHIYSIK
jgi:alpha-glucosidase